MPLIKSKSKQAFNQNVSEMIKAGHPQDQSLAAAYSIQRKSHASGGDIMNNDRMISDLMKRRKRLADGGVASNESMDQDEMPSLHERPDSAKMNNTSPNLQEQSRHDMGDNEDSVLDHKLSAEGRQSEREEALYAEGGPALDPNKAQQAQDSLRKAFKFKSGGKVSSGPHSSEKLAYGHGLSESEQQDEPRLSDEDSGIALAEGGIAYNSNLKENYPDDSDLVTDERSRIVFAQGGTVQGAKHLEANDEDTRESKDEASSITLAEGGSVEHAKRLEDDMKDTPESHDEDSSIAMAAGGDIAYTDIDEHEQEDTPEQLNEMDMAEGGQIEDDQESGMNPKSMQNEDAEERAMKKRRRQLMISALNE